MDFALKFVKAPLRLPPGLKLVLAEMRFASQVEITRSSLRACQSQAAKMCLKKLRREFGAQSVRYSVTHKGFYIAVAIGTKARFSHLGLDCEKILPPERAKKLARRILTLSEQRLIPTSPKAFAKAVSLIFSLKEAAYKSLPKVRQKGLGFKDFEVQTLISKRAKVRLMNDSPQKILFAVHWGHCANHILTLIFDDGIRVL